MKTPTNFIPIIGPLYADDLHTVKHSIELEKNTFLKTTLLHYYHKKNLGQLSKYDIAKTIGIL
jgi:hypothetical protein